MSEYRYFVGELEVCVVDEPTKQVRAPRPEERAVLDHYFLLPESRDPETGRVYRLYGSSFRGIDGLVLTYPAPTELDSTLYPTRAE